MGRFKEQDTIVIDTKINLIWPKNASLSDFAMTWYEALNFIKELNNSKLYGYNDWKLPNRRELYSLMSLSTINPSLQPEYLFENVFHGYYWTSTTCARLPDQAWYIHLGGARVFKGMKYQSYMVWPVRENENDGSEIMQTGQRQCYDEKGNIIDCFGTGQDGESQSGLQAPTPRFIEKGDTIEDSATHLMWVKDANVHNSSLDWQSAHERLEKMNKEKAFGYDDWRIPGIRELENLTDMGEHSPALSKDHPFNNVQEYYWSSTTSAYDNDYAWALYMKDGIVGVGYKSLSDFYLWPVRSIIN